VNSVPLDDPARSCERRAAVVVTDAVWVRRHARELLEGAGFAVATVAADELAGRRLAGDELIALLLTSDAVERLDAIRAIAKQRSGMRLLATMPTTAGGAMLRRALRGGADGIVLDDDLHAALAPTACALLAGQIAVPPALRRQLAPRALSHREKEILGLVVLGYTNAQIAARLFVAESTVKTHLSSAFAKLEASSRAEAAALILDPEEGRGLGILTPEVAPTVRRSSTT
jgi:DNA-binding NarL/FixJ family response regulator